MHIGILSFQPLENKITYNERRLKEEINLLGYKGKIYRVDKCCMFFDIDHPKLYYDNQPFPKCDVMISRPGASTTNIELDASIIKQFELIDIPIINSYLPITRAKNKLRTVQILDYYTIPVPKTVMIHRKDDLDFAIKKVGGPPVIIKRIFGALGIGVSIAETKRAIHSTIDTLWREGSRSIFLIQEYVKESKGEDTRVIVIGGKVLGGMLRKARKGEFRSNLHRGGIGEKIELTSTIEELALNACRVLGLDIAGVDIIHTKHGPAVMEVNCNPGFEGFEKSTGINVAKAIVEHASSLARQKIEKNSLV